MSASSVILLLAALTGVAPGLRRDVTLPPAIPASGTAVALQGPSKIDGFPLSTELNMADDLTTDGLGNQAKGAAKEVEGKVRNAAGGLTGDSSEQLKGKAKELEGKAQRKVGESEVDADN